MNATATTNIPQPRSTVRPTAQPESAPYDATAFAALIAAIPAIAPAAPADPILPESQMFDAPQPETNGRTTTARADAESRLSVPHDSRTDVRARLESAQSDARAATRPAQQDRGPSEKHTANLPTSAYASRPRGETTRDAAVRAPNPRFEPNGSQPSQSTKQLPSESEKSQTSITERTETVAQRAPAGGVIARTESSAARAESPAKAIGRVLGTPQSTTSESPRSAGVGQDTQPAAKHPTAKSSAPSNAPPKQTGAGDQTKESAFARMVRSLRFSRGQRDSSASIRLDPPRLGRMDVSVRMSGERITIDVRTESAEARELITARAVELRSALERHGLQIERFDVRHEPAAQSAFERTPDPDSRNRERETSDRSARDGRRRVGGAAIVEQSVPETEVPAGELNENDSTLFLPTGKPAKGASMRAGGFRVDVRA